MLFFMWNYMKKFKKPPQGFLQEEDMRVYKLNLNLYMDSNKSLEVSLRN